MLAGNGLASISVLDLLLEAWPASDLLVLAPPDDARHSWQPSLALAAHARGVAVLEPPRVNDVDVIAQLGGHGTDLLLSVYYTQIFHPELLDVVEGPAVNVHPSLLPRHRGTAPLIWAIADGDTVTGVTVHRLTRGVDTGPIVDQRTLPIHPDDTGYSLHMKAANLVRAGIANILRSMLAGEGLPDGREQSGEVSHHSKRDPSLNHIDWSQPRERVRNVVRALAPPLPGAYTMLGGQRVHIDAVCAADVQGPVKLPGSVDFRTVPGAVLVWAGDGPLSVGACRVGGVPIAPAALRDRLGVREGEAAR